MHNRSSLVVCLIYGSMYMSIPISHFIPSPLPPSNSEFVFCICNYSRGSIPYVNCFVFLKFEALHEANLSFYFSHLIQPKFKAIKIWRNPEITWQPNFYFNNHVFCPHHYCEFWIPSCVSSLPVKALLIWRWRNSFFLSRYGSERGPGT